MQKMQNFARSEPPPAMAEGGGSIGAAESVMIMEELMDLEEEAGATT